MKYCCGMFQVLLEGCGKRGLSVVVLDAYTSKKRYVFLLQARITDAEQPFTEVTPYPIALETTVGISYCPHCGKDLARFYAYGSLPMHPELVPEWDDDFRRLQERGTSS